MSGTPMTPERLAEIAVRAAHLYEYVQQPDEADVLAGTDVPALLARVAELEAERHSTNEALSEAAEALRRQRDRIDQMETQRKALRVAHVRFPDSDHCQHDGERWPCQTVAVLGDDERPVTGPNPTPMTVYLATPCDTCDHTLNWHRNDVGCTVDDCACGRFAEPTSMGGDVR